jgi:hypothetical protein
MLFEQLRDDLVLGLDFGFEQLDLFLLRALLPLVVGGVCLPLEALAGVFEELLLPVVVLGRVDVMFVAQIRDGNPIDQVFPYNRDFLLRR